MSPSAHRRLPLLALALLVPGFLFWISWPYSVDDAYILCRYSRHLADGQGLAWNPGGPPLEGYTNLLYVVIGAPLYRAGLDPVSFFKVLGVAGWVTSIALAGVLGRKLWGGGAAALLIMVPLACSPGFVFWAAAGLETTFFAALIMGALVLFTRDTPRADWAAAGLLVLAALARTEGPVYAVALALARAVVAWRGGARGTAWARRGLPWVVGFALPWGLFFLWRARYFGHWLPNPVLFKSTLSVEGQGSSVLVDFAYGWWPWLVLAAWGLGRARGRGLGLLAVVALGSVAYASASSTSHGSSTVTFYDCFLIPLVPPLAVLAGGALEQLWARRWWLGGGVAALLGAWTVFNPEVNPKEIGTYVLSHQKNVRPAVAELAGFLEQERPATYHLAIGDVGYLGWRFRGTLDNLYGLNDYEYTLVSKGNLDDWSQRLLARHPDGFVFVMQPGEHGLEAAHAAERRVLAQPEFSRDYEQAREFVAGNNPWRYVLFERRRAPAP